MQRWVRRHYPAPRIRARRRVETPPGAPGQVDGSVWPAVALRDGSEALFVLSWARDEAVVCSERKDLLAWLAGHNAGLRRLGGVPSGLQRIDKKASLSLGQPRFRNHVSNEAI